MDGTRKRPQVFMASSPPFYVVPGTQVEPFNLPGRYPRLFAVQGHGDDRTTGVRPALGISELEWITRLMAGGMDFVRYGGGPVAGLAEREVQTWLHRAGLNIQSDLPAPISTESVAELRRLAASPSDVEWRKHPFASKANRLIDDPSAGWLAEDAGLGSLPNLREFALVHGSPAVAEAALEDAPGEEIRQLFFAYSGRTTPPSHLGVFHVLLHMGGSPNAAFLFYGGRTPLHRIAERGALAQLSACLPHTPCLDAETTDGETPLWLAARNGQAAVVGLLLKSGADPSRVDVLGRTPRQMALMGGHGATARPFGDT